MNKKEGKIWKQIGEIKKQLWMSLIFFTVGILLAWLGFSQFGDKFMHDIWNESVGRWPVYLLLGTALGGVYLTIKYVGDKTVEDRSRTSSYMAMFRFIYVAMFLLAPVLFVVLIIYRFYQLRKLIHSLPDNKGQQEA